MLQRNTRMKIQEKDIRFSLLKKKNEVKTLINVNDIFVVLPVLIN